MKLSNFNFNLPAELLAEFPAENRDESRLMVVHRKTGEIEHKMFKDIIDYFDDGDVMVHQIYDHDSGIVYWEDKTNDEWTDNDEQLLDSLLMYGNLQETIGMYYV